MENSETFPAWNRMVEYFENSVDEISTKSVNPDNKIFYEDLLTIETYQLWKLLKKM